MPVEVKGLKTAATKRCCDLAGRSAADVF